MAEVRSIPSPAHGDAAATPTEASGWMPWLDPFLVMQRAQWEALAAWQQGLLAMQRELFDEWACRWAGGAPIDA